ncbi:MAG: hypothetical protein GX489_04600 [Firmicutes bacterium]|mgnify:CR=1 FL=1|jgi:hypothetical protein|nr:hypothetical protein [Bacillota bacterium]
MKRWLFLVLVLTAGILLAMMPAGSAVSGADPGTEEDPLVAKSYVDRLVRLQVVELEAGQVLRGEAGTEMVLRSGRAAAVVTAQGGISDLTAGQDIQHGETVPTNHLLLVPRSDGRGLKALTEVVVLVRGGVTVE